MHIELQKFGSDLSNPIAEPRTETEKVELYAGCSGKMVKIAKDMEPELKKKVIEVSDSIMMCLHGGSKTCLI